MSFEKWMKKTFDEPEWDEGWNRQNMADAFEAGKNSNRVQLQVKTANGGSKKVASYILEQRFNGEWYMVTDYETLDEAKEAYKKLSTARIIEEEITATLLFSKG